MRTHSLLLGAVLLLGCSGGPKAPPPSYEATLLPDTIIAPVVHVSDAVARSDSVWVVLGIEEGAVLVADFATGTTTPHPGITPEEVPGASVLFGVGDTIFVADWGLRRVTVWTADGRRIDAVPTPQALGGAFPRARDAAGQWYFEVAPSLGRDGRGVRDSAAVVRSDPLMTRFDTVARLAPPDVAEIERDGRVRLEPRALSGRDRWGVLRDGTVWLARVNQNQVFWYPPSGAAPSRTRPLPDPIIAVTEMDRQIHIRRYPEENRPNAAIIPFALVKPTFERAFAQPDGSVWLFKSAEALDTLRTFQVADSSGWRFSVRVPSYGIALGVTETEILMGEENPAGMRLLRYRIPTPGPPPPTP
jgi:hypothetical protein